MVAAMEPSATADALFVKSYLGDTANYSNDLVAANSAATAVFRDCILWCRTE